MNLIGLPELLHSNLGVWIEIVDPAKPKEAVARPDEYYMSVELGLDEFTGWHKMLFTVLVHIKKRSKATDFFGLGTPVMAAINECLLVSGAGVEEMLGYDEITLEDEPFPDLDTYVAKIDLVTAQISARLRNYIKTVVENIQIDGFQRYIKPSSLIEWPFNRISQVHAARLLSGNPNIQNEPDRILLPRQRVKVRPSMGATFTMRTANNFSLQSGKVDIDRDIIVGTRRDGLDTGLNVSDTRMTEVDSNSWLSLRVGVAPVNPDYKDRWFPPNGWLWEYARMEHFGIRKYENHRQPIPFFTSDPASILRKNNHIQAQSIFMDPAEHNIDKCDICRPQRSTFWEPTVSPTELKDYVLGKMEG